MVKTNLVLHAILLLFVLAAAVEGAITQFDINGVPTSVVNYPPNDVASILIPRMYCVYDAGVTITGSVSEDDITNIDIVLVSDISGSMNWDMSNSDSTPKIDIMRDVSTAFVEEFIQAGSDRKRAGLASYSTISFLDNPITSNSLQLLQTIDSYNAGGYTCISCGIKEAMDELERNGRDDAMKVIILMTDGLANRVIDGSTNNANIAKAEAYAYACTNDDSAVNRGYVIHTIAFGSDADTQLLQSIADCSPEGEAFIGTEADQLFEIYRMLGQIEVSSYPWPVLDIGENDEFEFVSYQELEGSIRWINDYCDNPIPNTYDCSNLVDVLNFHLKECNSIDGDDDCKIPIQISNVISEGIITLSDLSIEIAEAYLGPIVGDPSGGAYTCDLLVECEEGPDAASCLSGYPADTVVTLQHSKSMLTVDVPTEDGSLIQRLSAAKIASVEFAIELFSQNEYNRMGVVPYHRIAPDGRTLGLVDSVEGVVVRLESNLGTPEPICYACALYSSFQALEEGYPDSVKSIVLMSDGYSDRCEPAAVDGAAHPLCTHYGIGANAPEDELRYWALQDAVILAEWLNRDYQISIYTVGFGLGADNIGLGQISAIGGGEHFEANSLEDLILIYRRIANEVSGDCEGICRFTNYPPVQPDPFCGDGFLQDWMGEVCDWGSSNVVVEEGGLACVPDPGASCRVCTTECEYVVEEDDTVEIERTYCGDGPPPDQPNDDGIYEECDEGTDVNTWEPCTPVPGGTCYVCSPDCTVLEFYNPSNVPCIYITTGNIVNLNDYVSFLGGRNIELDWRLIESTGIIPESIHISPNNVLSVQLSGLTGQIVIEVSDSEQRTDIACFNFMTNRQTFITSPDPVTRLQIAKGRIVTGFYEEPLTGRVVEYGPYLISAQVWQK